MLARTRLARCAATNLSHSPSVTGLTHYGPTLPIGPQVMDESTDAPALGSTPRGVKNTSCFKEDNTAIYDGPISWSYFQPHKVNIEVMPAPEAKYYQRNTKKPWDISTTEWMELTYRKRVVMAIWWGSMWFALVFLLPKEKQFAGLRGHDGMWIMLPQNQKELFA
eukprot:PhM_4_TR4976/c0_g1_i1/m.86291